VANGENQLEANQERRSSLRIPNQNQTVTNLQVAHTPCELSRPRYIIRADDLDSMNEILHI